MRQSILQCLYRIVVDVELEIKAILRIIVPLYRATENVGAHSVFVYESCFGIIPQNDSLD